MNITPERLLLLLGALGVPGIIVILNFVVRGLKGLYYTAGSDFLVAQMTFSFSSAILSKDMAPYIQNEYIRAANLGIFIMLGLFILVAWVWAALSVEPALNEGIRQNAAPKTLGTPKLFVSWLLVITFFAAEIMMFVYR
jgi:hypothetical protein